MIPTEEELMNFIKNKDLVNFSSIAKHFKIKNNTVSDLILKLEYKKLVEVSQLGGNKIVRIKGTKNKKGQVTLYIILGLIILITAITIISLSNYVIKTEFEKEQESVQVIEQFKPVKNYLDSCISEIALEGAELIGLQGGYIIIPDDNLPVNPVIPFSNKLDFFGNNKLQVPYWFYETANGIQKQQIPSLQDMEKQLADYINLNVNDCLNNFTAFEGYQVNNFIPINTNVEIKENKILVKMLTNIIIDYKDLQVNFNKFLIAVDSPLGKLYNIGKEIFDKEDKESFFEQKTIDMLVLYDEIPYSGTSFDCSPRTWFVENVKKDLGKILKANIEAINPRNSGYFNFNINPGNSIIDFRYDDQWPLILSINGGEQILKEEPVFGKNNPGAAFLSTIFCFNNYHFIYDIKYPIIVTLNEGDYFFQYALQIIIDNNQPKENKLSLEYLGNTNPRVCESADTKTTITVRDENNNKELENSKIEFSCVGTTCDLGNTKKNGLTTLTPKCINAIISASKEGYHKNKITLDTLDESFIELILNPYYKKQIEFKIIEGNTIREIKDDEAVTLILTNQDEDYSIFLNNEIDTVNLLSGDYHIQSFIVKDYQKGLKLSKQNVEYCTDVPKPSILGLIGLKEKKCFKTELEETNLEKVIVGGVEFDWQITKDELEKGNKITFYIIYNKVPTNVQELSNAYQQILRNADSNNFRKPDLK